ncbi:hypothetical protein RAB70_06760 [Xanthomonas sontii]|uniref:hypothetical protein n=1 Tax=Xanthomonas sontii TaxID=2650745 RepID=UPI001478AB3C|nr:hypothetical protein CJ027_003535 [Xanthomonas sontii]
MHGDYQRLRELLLQPEWERLRRLDARLAQFADLLAEEVERDAAVPAAPSRLREALSALSGEALEAAVRHRPHTVVEALYPLIGATIRRALSEAMRQIGEDLDRALGGPLSPRSLWWRWLAWRGGVPYAQIALRHSARYRVEHLFLIQRNNGLLLGYLGAEGAQALDADAVAGMFSAIHRFVRDAVAGEADGLGSATVGDYRLAVSESPCCWLVAFVRGLPPSGFAQRLDAICEALHRRHGASLADTAQGGQAGAGYLQQVSLDALNPGVPTWQSPRARRHRRYAYAAVALVAMVVAVHAGLTARWSAQARQVHRELSRWPGLSLSDWDASRRGRLRIAGLLDPLADDPAAWLARAHPQVAATWRLQPFMSLQPLPLRRRVAQSLNLPLAIVQAPDADGTLRLVGEVGFAQWQWLRTQPSPLPGLRLQTTQLTYPGHARIAALVAQIQAIQIVFEPGTAQPRDDMSAALTSMIERVQALQDAGAAHAIGFRLVARGFTDDPGSYAQNRDLRRRRAEWLTTQLMRELRPPNTIVLDEDALATLPHRSDSRATSLIVTLFAVSP